MTFLAALVVGGVFTTSLLWAGSGLSRVLSLDWRGSIFTFALAVAILRDLRILRFPLPQSQRQVPRSVFRKGSTIAAAQFGFELGTGLRTYLPSTQPHLLALGVWLLASGYLEALLAGLGFGLGRGLMVLGRYVTRSCDDWDCLLSARWFVPACAVIAGLGVPVLLLV